MSAKGRYQVFPQGEWLLTQTYSPGSQLVRMSENKYKCRQKQNKDG